MSDPVFECRSAGVTLALRDGPRPIIDDISLEVRSAEFLSIVGPSGTGKTMAAQVIAAQIGQDLCRVNIAQLVSKWVGETPKNIEQVIRVASENNVVLFFDEADALFAKRSAEIRDAQDKFANTDTAFLLLAMPLPFSGGASARS